MPWDRVHEEAEMLEHVISRGPRARIAAKLGDPTHDPHGDPIPTARPRDRRVARPAPRRARAGGGRAFVRVSDSDPEMLRYLSERGIAPGMELRGRSRRAAVRRAADGGVDGAKHALGRELARAMRVEQAPVS